MKSMRRNVSGSQRKNWREADKIKIVTAAEAEAEKDRLHGVGIAQQRKAIVDGLAESITELKEANVGMTEEQIMSIPLDQPVLGYLEYLLFLKEIKPFFLPNTPNGVDDIRTQILSALRAEKK